MVGFNPLYRGTWVLTILVLVLQGPSYGFQSAISRYLGSDCLARISLVRCPAGSFNPLYRGTWVLTPEGYLSLQVDRLFQSAISRYLGSDLALQILQMNLLAVSIRYIAVLGF